MKANSDFGNLLLDDHEREFLKDIFSRLKRPVPQREDCFETRDEGRIVFLSPYGCAIRITEKDRKLETENIHALKPIFSWSAGSYIVDLNPGVRIPLDDDDFMHAEDMITRSGLFGDTHYTNIGHLGNTDFPVMIDLDCQSTTSGLPPWQSHLSVSRMIKKLILTLMDKAGNDNRDQEHEVIQNPAEELFGDIMEMAEKLAVADPQDCTGEAAASLWKRCMELKNQGMLHASWQQSVHKDIVEKSNHYENALIRDSMHFSLIYET